MTSHQGPGIKATATLLSQHSSWSRATSCSPSALMHMPPGSGRGHLSIHTHLLGHLIQSRSFKHLLYADVSKTRISSHDLSPQLQSHITNWLPDTPLGFLTVISFRPCPKEDTQFFHLYPDSFLVAPFLGAPSSIHLSGTCPIKSSSFPHFVFSFPLLLHPVRHHYKLCFQNPVPPSSIALLTPCGSRPPSA